MNFKMTSLYIGTKWLLIFVIVLLIPDLITAQPHREIDSIKHLLTTTQADSNKVNMLNDLSYLIMEPNK